MNLEVNIKKGKEESSILLSGEIDVYTAPQFKEKILPLTQIEGHLIIVDLADVHYMDSTGLGIFINALKSSRKHNSKLKLIHLQDRVLRLFEVTGLNEIIPINSGVRCK